MIANPKWFTTRKYTGWGLTPITWQGWVYTLFLVAPLAIVNSLNQLSANLKMGLTLAWAVLIAFEVIDTMIRLKKDERELLHEALAERNAMWIMVTVMAFGLIYKAIGSGLENNVYIDPVILTALISALFVKAATYFYLRDK